MTGKGVFAFSVDEYIRYLHTIRVTTPASNTNAVHRAGKVLLTTEVIVNQSWLKGTSSFICKKPAQLLIIYLFRK